MWGVGVRGVICVTELKEMVINISGISKKWRSSVPFQSPLRL